MSKLVRYRGWDIFIYTEPDEVHATGRSLKARLRRHLRAATVDDMRRLIDGPCTCPATPPHGFEKNDCGVHSEWHDPDLDSVKSKAVE